VLCGKNELNKNKKIIKLGTKTKNNKNRKSKKCRKKRLISPCYLIFINTVCINECRNFPSNLDFETNNCKKSSRVDWEKMTP